MWLVNNQVSPYSIMCVGFVYRLGFIGRKRILDEIWEGFWCGKNEKIP